MIKLKSFIFIIGTIFIISNLYAKPVPDGFADISEKAIPAVVNISTIQKPKKSNNMNNFRFDSPIPHSGPFGNELPDLLEKFYNFYDEEPRQESSLGSGFIIDPKGYIVTNYHVIANSDEISVRLSDDTKYEAKLIGSDQKTDLALLKIESKKVFPYLDFADSADSKVGEWVIAIGNPFGLGGSVTAGIISAIARDIQAGPFDDFLQIDAAINRGNSGGPLLNTDGKVIGINSAIFSPSGGNIGIGFAVPSALAEPVLKQLKDTGKVVRGWLGVKIQLVTEDIAESVGLKKTVGALVAEVSPNGPADKAGLKVGDVILSFNGKEVSTQRKLPRIVADTPIGKQVEIVILRKGKNHKLKVKLDELQSDGEVKSADNTKSTAKDGDYVEVVGLTLKELNDQLRKKYNIDDNIKGLVVVNADRKSLASRYGVAVGDVVTQINQQSVSTVNAAQRIVKDSKNQKKKTILLYISRGNASMFIAVPMSS